MQSDKELKEKLQAEYDIAKETFHRLSMELEVVKDRLELPELKERYEGRYFKYRNGFYSEDTWWVYYFIQEIQTDGSALEDCFEIDTDGECKFKSEYIQYYPNFEMEISKVEYTDALRAFTCKLLELGDRTI